MAKLHENAFDAATGPAPQRPAVGENCAVGLYSMVKRAMSQESHVGMFSLCYDQATLAYLPSVVEQDLNSLATGKF